MRRLATPFALLLALLVPTGALASGTDVIDDCALDEQLSKRYSQEEYRDALDNLPADVRQYTNCQAVIRRAQLDAAGGSGGGGGGGTSGPGGTGDTGGVGGGTGGDGGTEATPAETLAAATPEQKEDLAEAVAQQPAPVTLPGAAALDPADEGEVPSLSAVGELPAPLGVLLVLMVASTAVLGFNRMRNRVGGRSAA